MFQIGFILIFLGIFLLPERIQSTQKLDSFATCNIEKYFKPALDKTDRHRIRNIDFIYMINLDERPQKFEQSCLQLNSYGIYPYRFSAVNGWALPLETIDNVGVKYELGMNVVSCANHYMSDAIGMQPQKLDMIVQQESMHVVGKTYFAHGMSLGAIGIVLSHLSVLQDAYKAGYETIWVMEDDIHVIKDPNILSDLIDRLDVLVGSNWDVLFTDKDTKGHDGKYVPCLGYGMRPNFSPSNPGRFSKRTNIKGGLFRKVGARYGAYSMIIRKSGIKKILDFIKTYHIYLPYDFDFCLPNDIKLYTITDDVVSTFPNALSDNSAPYYQYVFK